VSPWTAGGYVCSQNFDHTSVLQFLEQFTGVHEPNISEWRRRTFGNLISALRFQTVGERPPSLPDTSGPLRLAKYQSAMLPNPVFPTEGQELPKQEKVRHKG
jgi:phospholipase C